MCTVLRVIAVMVFCVAGLATGRRDTALAAVTIQLEPVVTAGLDRPLYVTHAHDGSNRLFIVEQPGRIKVLQPGATSAATFLDITSLVLSGGERGLLGLAFHPQFPTTGRFFVDYTRRPDGATVVAEYGVSSSDPNVADPRETVLLTIPQPFENHNGGMIAFGPDGFLYIGMGDGGSANDPGNRAQNIDELLGKILRIDVDRPESSSKRYSSPPDNPFSGSIPGRDEIFALGLRNPWRFSFDRSTGQIYAGDVGQNAIEEIDIIARGGNYGWRVFEGSRCTNQGPAPCNPGSFISPLFEYPHTAGRCSVIGGYVYRGSKSTLPAGSYVFGDYCSGEIFLLDRGVQSVLLATSLAITSFGEDEAGEIYVAALGGSVWRIVNPNSPSAASLYYPRLVSTGGSGGALDDSEHTGIAIVNLDTSETTLRATAFDRTGAVISGSGIRNPAVMSLRAGQQLPIMDSEIFGVGLSAAKPVGWVLVESTLSKITGLFLMFNASLSVMDGADVSSNTLTSFLLPDVEDTGFTQIHVANPNGDPAEMTFELVGSDGSTRAGPQLRTANTNGCVVALVSDLFPGANPRASDYVKATANRPVVPFEYMGKTGQYARGLNGQDAAAGASTLYAPQYAVGGNLIRTSLSVVNLDDAPGTVTFELVGDDGRNIGNVRQLSLAGKGKLHITDPKFFLDPGDSLIDGYVRITSSGPRLAGSVAFGDPGESTFSAALPLVSTLLNDLVYSQFASDDTYFTGLAILNPGETPVRATLELKDRTGAPIASKVENLAARQRKSQLLTEYFPTIAGEKRTGGYFTVSADGGIASFAAFGTRTLSVLCAIPPQRRPEKNDQ